MDFCCSQENSYKVNTHLQLECKSNFAVPTKFTFWLRMCVYFILILLWTTWIHLSPCTVCTTRCLGETLPYLSSNNYFIQVIHWIDASNFISLVMLIHGFLKNTHFLLYCWSTGNWTNVRNLDINICFHCLFIYFSSLLLPGTTKVTICILTHFSLSLSPNSLTKIYGIFL